MCGPVAVSPPSLYRIGLRPNIILILFQLFEVVTRLLRTVRRLLDRIGHLLRGLARRVDGRAVEAVVAHVRQVVPCRAKAELHTGELRVEHLGVRVARHRIGCVRFVGRAACARDNCYNNRGDDDDQQQQRLTGDAADALIDLASAALLALTAFGVGISAKTRFDDVVSMMTSRLEIGLREVDPIGVCVCV